MLFPLNNKALSSPGIRRTILPDSLPPSARQGRKPAVSAPAARNLRNFFSSPPKVKVEEIPLKPATAPSLDRPSSGEARPEQPATSMVGNQVPPAVPEAPGEIRPPSGRPPLDLSAAAAIIKKVKFQNPSNHCYTNALVVGLFWIDLVSEGSSPFASSPLQGILRWLRDQKRVLLWQTLPWTRLVHSQGRWQSPNNQHDVCHLLMHLSHAVTPSVAQVSWRLSLPGRAEDEGNMWPLPLILEDHQMSLKGALRRWQQGGVKRLTLRASHCVAAG